MQTVGDILITKRLEKKLTLTQIEKATKIREKFLVLIEENKLNHFSSQTILKGFIRNYAAFLGLNTSEIMAFYRRQSDDNSHPVTPKVDFFRQQFRFTPKTFTIISVGGLLGLFFFFLIFQYWQFTSAPFLTINSPLENVVVKNEEVEVSGQTDPDAILSINEQPVAIDQKGNFNIKVPLSAGLNILTIKSINKFQKSSIKVRHLRLESS